MHELSIAQSIVDTARGELHSHPASTLKEIGLRIGALAGVLTDSLDFCFEAITKGTDLDGCVLAIEHLPVVAECRDCARSFEVEQFFFACPVCNSGAVKVTQGYELEIAYLEVDDAPPGATDFSTNGVHYAEENST
jgi:hydrogenase nickel incorporation protein HypA/HybF